MSIRHEMLRELKRSPALYTGEASLAAVKHFLAGYETALDDYKIGDPASRRIIPRAFHDWVAYRLNFYEATGGWCHMISEVYASEPERLARFFELLEEFYTCQPKVVARLTDFQQFLDEHPDHRHGRLVGFTGPVEYASSIVLVTYTDDPGFFTFRETPGEFPGEGYCPSLEAFELRVGATRDMLTIVDEDWYRRISTSP